MSILGIFTEEETKKVEEELKALKEKKLLQDTARIEEYEKQFVEESDAKALATLHPIVKVMVRRTLIQGKQAGLKFGIHMATRTITYQDELYHQGRTLQNGVWVITNRDLVVTNAAGGRSWHNYGLAVDFVFDGSPKPGYQWTWDDNIDTNKDGKDDWGQVGVIAEANGLTWGGRWRPPEAPVDRPHVQYHNGVDTVSIAFTIYKLGGIESVWEKIV